MPSNGLFVKQVLRECLRDSNDALLRPDGAGKSFMNLERFWDPARAEQVARLRRRAFTWEPQGYIPPGIHAVNFEW